MTVSDSRDSGLVDTPEGISPKRQRSVPKPSGAIADEKPEGKVSAAK